MTQHSNNRLDTLRKFVADEKGFMDVMGPLLGTLMLNSMKDLLNLEEQIEKRGFAVGNIDKLPKYVHNTSQNTYLLLSDNNVKLEADWSDGVAYIRLDEENGPLIIRNKEQFHDGRFTKVETEANVSECWTE